MERHTKAFRNFVIVRKPHASLQCLPLLYRGASRIHSGEKYYNLNCTRVAIDYSKSGVTALVIVDSALSAHRMREIEISWRIVSGIGRLGVEHNFDAFLRATRYAAVGRIFSSQYLLMTVLFKHDIRRHS